LEISSLELMTKAGHPVLDEIQKIIEQPLMET